MPAALLSLALHWGAAAGLPLVQTLARVTSGPAGVLGGATGDGSAGVVKGVGTLVAGGPADLCVFDPAALWSVQAGALRSQGKHTPFSGYELPGRVRYTVVAGTVAFDAAPS
jgi:dihydroorotase